MFLGDFNNNDSPLVDNDLTPKEPPKFSDTVPITNIPDHSIDSMVFIPLTDLFSSEADLRLHYRITIKKSEIFRDEIENSKEDKKITVDMIILLPLQFSITSPAPSNYSKDFAKLDFGDKINDIMGDGDLFSRTGDGNDLFDYIDKIKIIIKDVNNTLIDKESLALLVETRQNDQVIEFKNKDLFLNITGDDIRQIPFNPKFTILLRKDSGKNYGILKILRPEKDKPPAFNFKLDVEAAVKINYTIDLKK